MEYNYEKILWEGYGLRFYGGNRIRTGYLCKTDKGLLEIRKNTSHKKQILFEYDIKEHLYQKGFCNINRLEISQQGLPYYTWEENDYIVEKAVETEPLEEEEKQTFVIGAKTLAKLHNVAKGLNSTAGYFAVKNRLKIYEKRRIELLKIKKRIEKQGGYSALDLLVKQNYNYYIEKIEQANELFLEAEYEKEMKRVEQQKTVCHNAFKGENIRKDEKGNVFVTGFSKCTYDNTIVDLAMYFKRFLKKQQWDVETVENMFSVYHNENPLSLQDKKMLLALFIYPEKFLSLCNEYYNKRRVCVSPAMLERMEVCIAGIEKNEKMIKWLQTI
ncbi:MAG: hypothetical protein HFE58_06180 [Firmicutes bacterium]|nr:hypothetical protein [Bacillota bacterium]